MRRLGTLLIVASLILPLAATALAAEPGQGSGGEPTDPPSGTRTLTASDTVVALALAVADTGDGLVGVSAEVHATVIANGTGQVFVDTKPLAQTDMQGSARLAARVAADTLGVDHTAYDYLVVFRSRSVVIGGPSAGSVMTLALTVALHNVLDPSNPWTIDKDVAGTGTINPDGTIGPVGGIPQKAQAARDRGVDAFLYPIGQDRVPLVRQTATGPVREEVHMPTWCQEELDITCRPAATIRDLVEHEVGVRLEQEELPVPTTARYEEELRPRVEPEVEGLAVRLEAAFDTLAATDLPPDESRAVEESLLEARDRLDRARTAMAEGRFYTGATMAFQGAFWTGHAEFLTAFFEQGRSARMVEDALQACEDRTAEARAYAIPLNATTLHELYAVGAAQRRVAEAEDLLEQATEQYTTAARVESWIQALFSASFCVERAKTVIWWADVRHAFGPGPAVEDPEALAREVLDLSQELVTYSDAVLGRLGQASTAARLLQDAEAALRAGRPAEAILAGVEAQSEASLAVQRAAGPVPREVVEAAEAATAREVQEARNAGVEPILSVALLELSRDLEEPESALPYLWTARGLAGLTIDTPPPAPQQTFVGQTPYAADQRHPEVVLRGVAAAGFILGVFTMAALSAAIVTFVRDD